jgi:hypothetical protein
MVASGVFATHHMVPVEALRDEDLKQFFRDYFPGFNIESHANFAEKARNPFAGQQLNIGTQDSDHPWIITALKRIRTEVLSINVDADGNRVLADSLNIDFVKRAVGCVISRTIPSPSTPCSTNCQTTSDLLDAEPSTLNLGA